jgi:cytoskeletal protein CcmA (bactofilin family)
VNHIDEMTCLLYLDGQLDRARAIELVAHAESCADCRQLLGVLEQESRLLHMALVEEDEPIPAGLLAPRVREVAPWAWIAALGFAAAGAYFLWTGITEWQQNLDQVGMGGSNLLTMLFFGGAFWKGWTDMIDWFQFLATGTLLVVGVSLLTRLRRRWTTVAVVMSALLAMFVLPSATSAAEIHKEKGSYALPPGQTVANDLFVFAKSAKIDGTVDGDLIVFAATTSINGEVKGDVIAFGANVTINGTVQGSVLTFAQGLRITGKVEGSVRGGGTYVFFSGPVAKNAMIFSQGFDLDPKAEIGGSLTLFTENSGLDGRIGRDLLVAAQTLRIGGFVGGAANVRGIHLTIDPSAEIKGAVEFRGRDEPEVAKEAKLASPVKFEKLVRTSKFTEWNYYKWQGVRWAASFVFGMVLVWLGPLFFREAMRAGDRVAQTLGAGIVAFVAPLIAAIIACITLVGLAVGIGTIMLWIIGIYASKVFAGAWLGEKLLGESLGAGAVLARMALGLLILRVGAELPYVGGWIGFLVLLWGLGLLGRALYRRVSTQPAVA